MSYRPKDQPPIAVPYWCPNHSAWFVVADPDEFGRQPTPWLNPGECDHTHEVRLIPAGGLGE